MKLIDSLIGLIAAFIPIVIICGIAFLISPLLGILLAIGYTVAIVFITIMFIVFKVKKIF